MLFRNRSHGELNVVYRRADGTIGWIDPANRPANSAANFPANSSPNYPGSAGRR
jgi:hypothetical protein